MTFNSTDEIRDYLSTFRAKTVGNRHTYPIIFKKAVAEFILKNNLNRSEFAKESGLAASLIVRYLKQYKEGLYETSAATHVSRVAKHCHSEAVASLIAKQNKLKAIIKESETEIAKLNAKIQFAKQAEQMGFKLVVDEVA